MPRRAKSEPSRDRVVRRVYARRVELALTQQALGDLAGLHRTYVGAIERGEVNVSLDNLDRLAAALKIDASALVQP